MSKYFTSVLRLVESGVSGATVPVQADEEESKLSVQLPADQPHPPSCSSEPVSLSFDKIFPPGVAGSALYKQTVKEVVESALMGYHGTVITLGCSNTKQEQSDFTWDHSNGTVQRATKQIIRCLKKSQASKSKSSTANLVVLCSYVLVVNEEIRDLLHGFSLKKYSSEQQPSHIPPKLVGKELSSASQHAITAGPEVSAMLRYGKSLKKVALDVVPVATPTQCHHTIFTLTVEFSQFGSMTAPVSGNLRFVDLAMADPLASRQRYTRGDKVDTIMLSLFSFADVVEVLSSNVAVLETMQTQNSAFNQELEKSFLPHVPSATASNQHEKSVLTQLLREPLGGNCKTLLVTFVPVEIPVPLHSEVLVSLKLASRARIIQNTPNKRDLAEKALMSAYLRGLQEMYGQSIGGAKGKQDTELVGAEGVAEEEEEEKITGTQRESLR